MDADDYEFDVFLSYRRFALWPQWVERIFLPVFIHWLGEELGQEPRIFVDLQLEAGCAWPSRLGEALARSRILVPLWSAQYFNSDWCKAELAHMRAREALYGIGAGDPQGGLIIPAILHDGDKFPPFARGIQSVSLHDYATVRMAENSPTAELLELKIKRWVPSIAHAVERAPYFNPDWRALAIDEFLEVFQSAEPRQFHPPLVHAS